MTTPNNVALNYVNEQVFPQATYSPWRSDEAFLSVFESIEGTTMVDIYRCYELWTLVDQVAKLDPGSIVEVGVWRGGTSAMLAAKSKQLGLREKIYSCDTFSGVVKAGPKDNTYVDGIHSDVVRQEVDRLFSNLGLDNIEILQGIFPDETGKLIENQKFRLCHIDVDVYQSAADIVSWIWEKMVPGGIIVYDDYGFGACAGITLHVAEQMGLKDRLVLHNLNGHALVIKR